MPGPPHPTLYGRRKGKPLSARRTSLMADVYPQLAVDITVAAPARLAQLFAVATKEVCLEIGFGGGEHLVGEAARRSDEGFIGAEPFVNGMAKAVAGVVDEGLGNVRLFPGDASDLLAWLPPASLAAVDLLYPDPWPKKRHWKRRFVSDDNLDRIARALAPGGRFRFASDIPAYVEWTLGHLARRRDFAWTAEAANDWRLPFADWIPTRYEDKARKAGRIPTYLEYSRL
jgi:tRNA (guanine-N7-)-methyltransferase